MTTLRSKLIKLAHTHPEVRPHVLPLLKTAGTPVDGTGIRTAYYKASDGIGALEDAVSEESATKADQKLKLAVGDLKEALDKVTKALKPYDWD